MCIAQLTIVPASSSRKNRADVIDAAEGYLAFLYKHGQMYGDSLFGWVGNRLQIVLELAGPDAHLRRSHSKWGPETREASRPVQVGPELEATGKRGRLSQPCARLAEGIRAVSHDGLDRRHFAGTCRQDRPPHTTLPLAPERSRTGGIMRLGIILPGTRPHLDRQRGPRDPGLPATG